jgi:putative membrane protein
LAGAGEGDLRLMVLQTLAAPADAFLASPLDHQVDCAVVIAALLSSVHILTLALGLGAVFSRGRALAGPLDDAGWQRLLAADDLWGVAAGLWIASGLGRVFFGGKEPRFYWHNGFFWVKLALFALVFALELTPMVTFIRVRSARRRGTALPRFPVEAYRRINAAEVVLIVAIVFVAAFMARGAWLF